MIFININMAVWIILQESNCRTMDKYVVQQICSSKTRARGGLPLSRLFFVSRRCFVSIYYLMLLSQTSLGVATIYYYVTSRRILFYLYSLITLTRTHLNSKLRKCEICYTIGSLKQLHHFYMINYINLLSCKISE